MHTKSMFSGMYMRMRKSAVRVLTPVEPIGFPAETSMKVMRRHFGLDKIERFNPPGFQGYDSVLVLQRARDPQK